MECHAPYLAMHSDIKPVPQLVLHHLPYVYASIYERATCPSRKNTSEYQELVQLALPVLASLQVWRLLTVVPLTDQGLNWL